MSYGIRTSIGVNLAFLFLFAMGVTAFFALTLVRQIMVTHEVERALHLAHAVAEMGVDAKGKRNLEGLRFVLGGVAESSAVSLVKVSLLDDDLTYGFGSDSRSGVAETAIKKAAISQKPVIQKGGSSRLFGFEGAIVVAVPLDASVRGGVAVVVATEKVNAWLEETLKLLGFYILVNLCVVTFAGVYQVSKVAIKPVTRLLSKAENAGTESHFIFHEEAGSDFSRLSMALNTMIARINADREKLQASVRELEGANAELKKAQAEVVRAEKLAAMGRLASGVAHEIGNPLGIITGYLSLLKSTEKSDEKLDFIQRTEEEVGRIDRIIRQLLDFNRTGAEGEKEVVGVHALVGEIRELVRVQPLFKGIDFSTDLLAGIDGVMATPGELRQVFVNMVLNSADAIVASGRGAGGLAVSTRNVAVADGDSLLEVVFEDNGEGIDEGNLGNIFDPFFTTKEPGYGTGLGLSVSFMIVEGLGGSLSVESTPGVGTRMILRLPVQNA